MFKTPYETLDELGQKSGLMKAIADEMKAKDEKITNLEGMVMELTIALAMMGGGTNV